MDNLRSPSPSNANGALQTGQPLIHRGEGLSWRFGFFFLFSFPCSRMQVQRSERASHKQTVLTRMEHSISIRSYPRLCTRLLFKPCTFERESMAFTPRITPTFPTALATHDVILSTHQEPPTPRCNVSKWVSEGPSQPPSRPSSR
jgi:hypothetical protein